MEFREFAERASAIEETAADLEVVSLVADCLDDAGADLAIVARFVRGEVFPAWSSRTLDVGPNLCREALARAAGPNVDADAVEDRLADVGDVGEVAAGLDLGGQTGLDAFTGSDDEDDGSGDSEDGGSVDGRSGDNEDSTDGTDGGPTVGEVFDELSTLAAADGAGSQDRKLGLLFGLFADCSPVEARYLARLVLGELRIGVGGGAVRDAIAEAFDVPSPAVARALQVTNDYGLVAERAREGGSDALAELHLEVGRPVQAMLAQAGTVTEALEDWGEAVVETKLDGARVQVHYAPDGGSGEAAGEESGDEDGGDSGGVDGEVQLFSRNLEDVTDALPEIVEFVESNCRPPAILDGEVVAVDAEGEPLPFQEVLRRFRRKHDVAGAREDVATELHVFDCLHAPDDVADDVDYGAIAGGTGDGDGGRNGEGEPSHGENSDDATAGQAGLEAFASDDVEPDDSGGGAPDDGSTVEDDGPDAADAARDPVVRRGDGVDLLDAPLRVRRAFLEAVVDDGVVSSAVTDDPDEIEGREEAALAASHEGVMLKNPASTYTPGRRGKDWLKRKPDVETLDLVVTGAEWGEGRRANLLGTFHLAARTDDGYARVGNVATGLTDEELEDLHERLVEHVESEAGQTVDLEPAVVFEVGYEEIQRSPTYDSGYALRFPRFVAVREDLDPDDADGLERVERLAEG